MPLKLSPSQIAFNARGDGKFNKPFTEQVKFFRDKINLPTERFDDILKSAHDRAFVVAGAMKADLLNDLRLAVDRSISEGKSIGWFRSEFNNIVARHGWQGWTGSDTQEGRDWRTRVIYNTNLRSSYAAGRWAQLNDPDLLQRRPFWKYVHNDTVQNPRPLHVAWSGLVLRHDDPWWQTHFPPNGWGCRCRVTAVRESEYNGANGPDEGVYVHEDRGGNRHVIPKGIDYGWDYAPGASVNSTTSQFIQDKIEKLPPALGVAFSSDMNRRRQGLKFVESKTVKQAESWSVDNNLVDTADYSKIDIGVANAMNLSLFEHVQEFPELRKQQKFIGSTQAHYERIYQYNVAVVTEKLIEKGVGRSTAESFAKRRVKKSKVKGEWAALSINHSTLSGISVNRAHGKKEVLDKLAQKAVKDKFHPVGTGSAKAIFDHEFGHQLDALLDLSKHISINRLFKEALKDGIEDLVSGYAGRNIFEFIAEAWAEAKNNPSPRYVASQVAEIVREEYERKFGKQTQ